MFPESKEVVYQETISVADDVKESYMSMCSPNMSMCSLNESSPSLNTSSSLYIHLKMLLHLLYCSTAQKLIISNVCSEQATISLSQKEKEDTNFKDCVSGDGGS